MARHKLLNLLFLFCVGCVPETTTQPPQTFVLLNEGDRIEDFADQIDSADVLALSGSGRALGVIDNPVNNQADIDVIRVISTPGKLLHIIFLPGSGAGADLQPFLVVTDSSGKVLGLHDGAIERSAEVDVVVPTQSSLFIVLQDARNAKETDLVGGGAFDYSLNLSEEELNPEDLGPVTANSVSSDSVLSAGGLALYLFQATAGKKYSIIIDPDELAETTFIPFLAFYSSSFELGAVITTDTPLQAIQDEVFIFGSGQTPVLFGVSDFSGGFGDNYLFTVTIQEQP